MTGQQILNGKPVTVPDKKKISRIFTKKFRTST